MSDSFEGRVAAFLQAACVDWRVGGSQQLFLMHDAERMLQREPAIATANLYTAVVCGELGEVQRRLAEDPSSAVAIGGPRSWPPLLYLCDARLPGTAWARNAPAIAGALLDAGADPNVFYLGGNADIHYTALTCVLGRGEERKPSHPRARALAALLLERGADPHDGQLLYNVFADHASRPLLSDDDLWLLELMHRASVARGHAAEWANPDWPMFDLSGAPSLGEGERRTHGARFMLQAAVDANLPAMAGWMLAHGAGPDTGWGELYRRGSRTLWQEAVATGRTAMAALLARHGAATVEPEIDAAEQLVQACLTSDERRIRALLASHPGLREDPRALFAAVARDLADVVRLLLDLGVSPDLADDARGGNRALHVAAYSGAGRSAQLLIDRGADVDARERGHHAIPLDVASWAQQPRMIELLGRYSRDVWELTYTGRVARLRELLEEQPELARLVSEGGETPLMWLPNDAGAALETARLLLEHGADPLPRRGDGISALDIARRRGLDAVAALLEEHGAGSSSGGAA